jgi:hypothetical protein
MSPFMLNGEEIYVEGLCVIFTILRRLEVFLPEILLGGMCIGFGWTEEQAIELLVQETGLPPEEAKMTLEILGMSSAIEWKNDLEIATLFSS